MIGEIYGNGDELAGKAGSGYGTFVSSSKHVFLAPMGVCRKNITQKGYAMLRRLGRDTCSMQRLGPQVKKILAFSLTISITPTKASIRPLSSPRPRNYHRVLRLVRALLFCLRNGFANSFQRTTT